ncbi:unnamed protein product [Symbiodinium sp. CCMP2592]|nr:unnamed protein product [Symbiodinium sp. CCMP2592]CAE7196711.1 unnamed protein product [Symbiodinium sp. CCMP2592]
MAAGSSSTASEAAGSSSRGVQTDPPNFFLTDAEKEGITVDAMFEARDRLESCAIEASYILSALGADPEAYVGMLSLLSTPAGQTQGMELLMEELLPQVLLNSPHHEVRKAAQKIPGIFQHPHPENLITKGCRRMVDDICKDFEKKSSNVKVQDDASGSSEEDEEEDDEEEDDQILH